MLHVFGDALVIPVEVGMPDLPVIEIVSLDVLETEGDRRNAVHDEMGVIGTPSLFRNRTSFPEAYLEREIRIDRRNRFANLDEIVVHRLGNGHGCGDGRSAVPVEVVRDLLQGNGFLLDESGTIVIDNASQCDTMEVPQGITVVGHFALSMRSFKTLILPDSLHTIGRCAFCDSYNLDFTEVFIPDSVKKIGEYAFDGCDLEKIHLPAYLETIPKGCFNHNCFTSIEWPQTLKHIEDKAFRCSDLEKIVLPEGVEDVGYDVFEGHHLRISLPSTLKKIEKDFYYEECVDDPELCLPFIEVHPDNPYFFAKDGTLYSRDDADTPYLGYTYPKPKIRSNPKPDPCGDCSKCPYNREYDKGFIDESLARFLEEAQNGDVEKQEVVAAMYATDRWIEHDYDKAYYWYSKAAQQGSSLAMEAIADAYYAGTWLEKDYGKTVEWLQKAAGNGYAKAVNNLASCYEEGKGVEVDLEKALQLYLQASEMGYDTAEDVKRLQSCKEEKSID